MVYFVYFVVHFTEHDIASYIMFYTYWYEELDILYIQDGSMFLYVDTLFFILYKGYIILILLYLIHVSSGCNYSLCNFYAIVFHPLLYTAL